MKRLTRWLAAAAFGTSLMVSISAAGVLAAQVIPTNPLRSSLSAGASAPSAATQPVYDPQVQPAGGGLTQPARFQHPSESTPLQPVRQAQYVSPSHVGGHPTQGFVPAHLGPMVSSRMQGSASAPEPMVETLPEGTIMEGPIMEGSIVDGTILQGDPMLDGCNSCSGSGCQACLIPCPSLNNIEFFSGVHGFTNPTNRGGSGSFGFDYGFNWAVPMWCLSNGALGAQVGFRGAQSNFDGAAFTNDVRNQYFITAGLFRRVDYGLQGGLVVDYLGESWYYSADVTQLRGEASWMFPACHELGFWFAVRTKRNDDASQVIANNQIVLVNQVFQPIDQYRFFYRRRFEDCGAEGRFSAGFTGDGDGLIGADLQLPISNSWALESTFTYLIPKGDSRSDSFAEEAWNVAFGLVWYPGLRDARTRDYYRPLFDVADNGSLIMGTE